MRIPPPMLIFQLRLVIAAIACCILSAPALGDDADQEQFFETQVRPLLARECFGCHGEKKQQGGLRLDRKQFVFNESDIGKAVVPNNLGESRLWKVIQYDEFDTQMPPNAKLSDEKIQILRKWIESGAYWPDEEPQVESSAGSLPLKEDGTIDFEKAIAKHWAYQPVTAPEIPEDDRYTSPIDRFVAAKLNEHKLSMSESASKRQLIRRLSFDLRGLPPGYEEVQAFANSAEPDAFEKLIDRYLADTAYGERWGRYWLDIARYADTKGYVFTENRFYPYSYTYRDYVIESFNNDKPYDTFLIEQLAADHLELKENDPRMAALGFLTVGPRFLNRTPDIIDDRIDVITRGLMGMTMGCARCHDHKFDPLPMADYYSLYGVFDSSYEPELPPLVGEIDKTTPEYKEFEKELNKREQAVNDYVQSAHQELLKQAREHLADYIPEAIKAAGILPAETELTPKHSPLRDRLKLHWKNVLEKLTKEKHPALNVLARVLTTNPEMTLQQAITELKEASAAPALLVNRLSEVNPQSKLEVVQLFAQLLDEVRKEWDQVIADNPEATQLADADKESMRSILYGPGSLSDLEAGEYSPLFERDNRDKVRNLQKQIEEWHATSPNAPPRAMAMLDKEKLVEPVIFIRGNAGRRGDRVPRRAPQILNPNPESVFAESSGRLELGRQIASKENPLTARVLVNRLWMYHFGTPLVSTPGDFGLRTTPPAHVALLDYLAWSLMHEHNWSIKSLHKEILLSEAWQQSSVDRPDARKIDPENQLYWKQNRQRLNFEAMRDSLLSVSGKLNPQVGGHPVNLESKPFPLGRTVYGLIDRNNPSILLRTFDFPTPNSSSPARSETTVPQQALFGMNSEFAAEMAAALSQRVEAVAAEQNEQITKLFQFTLARDPSEQETEAARQFLASGTLQDLAQALTLTNEFFFVD